MSVSGRKFRIESTFVSSRSVHSSYSPGVPPQGSAICVGVRIEVRARTSGPLVIIESGIVASQQRRLENCGIANLALRLAIAR
jgi:hypothetical protein